MSNSLWPYGLSSPWNSAGQNTGVDSLSLLQGIFPTQRSYPSLPHYRQILYQLSHNGSPRIVEWVAYPFYSRSFGPGIELGSPALEADSLPTKLSGKSPEFNDQIEVNIHLALNWSILRVWKNVSRFPYLYICEQMAVGSRIITNKPLRDNLVLIMFNFYIFDLI